jgi:hypothetical protein
MRSPENEDPIDGLLNLVAMLCEHANKETKTKVQ